MKRTQGFSLIELMIIVAIIGILSLIALPAYNNYILRVKITEVFTSLQNGYKTCLAEALLGEGTIDQYGYIDCGGNDLVVTSFSPNTSTYVSVSKFSNNGYLGTIAVTLDAAALIPNGQTQRPEYLLFQINAIVDDDAITDEQAETRIGNFKSITLDDKPITEMKKISWICGYNDYTLLSASINNNGRVFQVLDATPAICRNIIKMPRVSA